MKSRRTNTNIYIALGLSLFHVRVSVSVSVTGVAQVATHQLFTYLTQFVHFIIQGGTLKAGQGYGWEFGCGCVLLPRMRSRHASGLRSVLSCDLLIFNGSSGQFNVWMQLFLLLLSLEVCFGKWKVLSGILKRWHATVVIAAVAAISTLLTQVSQQCRNLEKHSTK